MIRQAGSKLQAPALLLLPPPVDAIPAHLLARLTAEGSAPADTANISDVCLMCLPLSESYVCLPFIELILHPGLAHRLLNTLLAGHRVSGPIQPCCAEYCQRRLRLAPRIALSVSYTVDPITCP